MLNHNVKHAQLNNLTMVYGLLELGTAVMENILGGDETANVIEGETMDRNAIRESMATTLAKELGA